MTPHRDALLAKAREWIVLADDDLRVARHTLSLAEAKYQARPGGMVLSHTGAESQRNRCRVDDPTYVLISPSG